MVEEREPEPELEVVDVAEVEEGPELGADPAMCEVHGLEHDMTVRTPGEFTIVAMDEKGNRRRSGGDAFFIAIRGASRVRARVADTSNGAYHVQWKPVVSGSTPSRCRSSASRFWIALPVACLRPVSLRSKV